MATMHTLGGLGMREPGARAARQELATLGVMVLTAKGAEFYSNAVGQDRGAVVAGPRRPAGNARRIGLTEVAGPARVAARVAVPETRRRSDASGDQVRVSPVGDAARGSTHFEATHFAEDACAAD